MAIPIIDTISPEAHSVSQERSEQGLPSHFARSVPGQSLTQSPGEYAWENPPRITTVEEAYELVMQGMRQPDNLLNLSSLIDAGVSIESIVRGVTFNGFIEGQWTPDVAEMLNPILIFEILAFAKQSGIPIQDIRMLNSYPDAKIPASKTVEIMKELNPIKYERKRKQALAERDARRSKTTEQPMTERESFMDIIPAPEILEEPVVTSQLPFMDQKPFAQEMPMEDMPVDQTTMEELPVDQTTMEELPEEII